MKLNGPAMINLPSDWLATLVTVPVRLVVAAGPAQPSVIAPAKQTAMSTDRILQGNCDMGEELA